MDIAPEVAPASSVCEMRFGRSAFRREMRGWSQAELAFLMGVSPNTIARWERGERRIPNLAHSWRWLYMEYEERA